MKKRIVSLLLAVLMLLPFASSVIPFHVHADGDDFRCPNCDSWLGDKDFCAECWFCEECEDICSDCGYCKACAMEDELHCPECGDACIAEEYGDVPHCVACNKCEECAELIETSEGLMCKECIEDRGDTYVMCPHCGVNAIGTELDDLLDESDLETVMEGVHPGDCGEHCEDCYEEFLCPECSECTLCKDVELCETCGICEECAMDCGYHCPDCGACYAEAGQCPEEGEHCVNCCENVCEDCGRCTIGADLDYCESCQKCEECWEHCEVCEECFEDNGECEEHGDHCAECCVREGWICDGCGRCTEALDLEKCEYCHLCTECCEENRKYYGTATCILDKETKPEDLDASKHDENHHILKYQSSSAEEHDAYCIFPGCEYYVTEPHEFIWKVKKAATETSEGLREGFCHLCSDKEEEVIPKLEIKFPTYSFVVGPHDMEVVKEKSVVSFKLQLDVLEEGETLHYAAVAAIPWNEGEALPDNWPELRKNVYHVNIIEGSEKTIDEQKGVCPARIYYTSYAHLYYGGKYEDFEAAGKKLTWRLAIYDRRGNGGKLVWSDPFTIDWDSKHTVHVDEWVSGPLPKGFTLAEPVTIHNYYYQDGTFHWLRCTICGQDYPVAYQHDYKKISEVKTCSYTVTQYVCRDCGHQFQRKTEGGDYSLHVWVDYKSQGPLVHSMTCKICGYTTNNAHSLDVKKTSNCTGTVTVTVCKLCNYAHMEKDFNNAHQYASDGSYNGFYGNATQHWKVCKVCGYMWKENHKFYDGHCTVCGINSHQMIITGSLCQHGVLHIERSDDLQDKQKQRFDAGQYGVTWIDEDTDATIGLGKTYELGPKDEGRVFRAEIQFMNTDGWEWWEKDLTAYMEDLAITTKYKTVTGYAATCAAEGLKTHNVCLACGDTFISGEKVTDLTIPKTGVHTFENDCDSICDVCGFQRETAHKWSDKYSFTDMEHYRVCTVCGAQSLKEIHQFKVDIVKEQTCSQDGLTHISCACGYELDEVLPKLEHKLEHVDEVAGTCISYGMKEHFACKGCHEMTLDAEGKEKAGYKKLQTPMDPQNHVGGDKIGYNETEHYTICACGAHFEASAHIFDEDGRCGVCGYKKGSDVKTGAKALTKHEMVHATCIKEGMKEYYTDEAGKMYFSKAGMIEVAPAALVIPKSETRHVGGDIAHSASEHWIACACGAALLRSAHTFGENGKCTVCGFDKTNPGAVTVGPADGGQGKDARFPWWILFVIGAVVIAAAVVVILLLIKKKEQEEDRPDPSAPREGPDAPQNGETNGNGKDR